MNTNLNMYATLLLQIGLDFQSDQTLIIQAPLEAKDFIHILSQKAYELHARYVHVQYIDANLDAVRYKYSPANYLAEYPEFLVTYEAALEKENIALLKLQPGLFSTIPFDPSHESMASLAKKKALQPIKSARKGKTFSSCSALFPTPAWAKQIFPTLSPEDACLKLWDHIFTICLCDQMNALDLWEEKIEALEHRKSFLNQMNLRELHFKSEHTDLKVKLAPAHFWCGASERTIKQQRCLPNFPTEELFTANHKFGLDGTLSTTKPFIYKNQIIDEMTLVFKEGRVIQATSPTQSHLVQEMIKDESLCYVGEIALVSSHTKLAQMNTSYRSTLLDENTGCHLALGHAYTCCIQPPINFTLETYNENQIHFAQAHYDLVFGSTTLSVIGVDTHGNRLPLLEQGEWVIQ